MRKKSKVLTRMYNKINTRNQNLLIAFFGSTGSGKSWSAIRLAEQLDPEFDVDRVIFTPAQLMHIINNPKQFRLKKGSIIVWDETGVNFASRDFFKEENKAISKVLQTFRHKNLGLILTVPHKSFIDIHARKLLHYEIQTLRIDYRKKQTTVKVFQMQVNPSYKAYNKYPLKIGDEGKGRIHRLIFNIPSKELIRKYEAKKEAFTRVLNKSIEKEFLKREEKTMHQNFDTKEAITYMQKNIKDFLKEFHGKIIVDKHKISNHFNIGDTFSRRIKGAIHIDENGECLT